jgi:hypothetical protein
VVLHRNVAPVYSQTVSIPNEANFSVHCLYVLSTFSVCSIDTERNSPTIINRNCHNAVQLCTDVLQTGLDRLISEKVSLREKISDDDNQSMSLGLDFKNCGYTKNNEPGRKMVWY